MVTLIVLVDLDLRQRTCEFDRSMGEVDMRGSTRISIAIALAYSSPDFSQEKHDMPGIDVDGRSVGDRPGPSKDGPGPSTEGPGSSGGTSGSGSSSSTGAVADVEITLGPTVLKFTPAVAVEVASLLAEYEKDTTLSAAAGGVAAIFTLYGLVDVNPSLPKVAAALKGVQNPDGGINDAIAALSATDSLAKAARGKAVRALDGLILKAATRKGGSNDFKVLRQIRAIILNPQRYKDDGIKYDKVQRKLMLRSDPGEKYRGVAGAAISMADVQGLQNMTNSLLNLPGPASFLLQADYLLALSPDSPMPSTISLRDLMVINAALQTLSGPDKAQVSISAQNAGLVPGRNKALWDEISLYPYTVAWNTGPSYFSAPDYTDPMGFPDNTLLLSDLVG